jgi:hypothetical protein
MKKIYPLLCMLFYLMSSISSFSQPYLLKSELMPDQSNRDSRFAVQATVMDNDTWCKVTWPDPENGYWEIAYDDNDAEDFFIWSAAGNMSANKFHPSGYPFILIGGRIYVGDGSFPGPFLGTSFRVLLFDDDGEDGLPGTALDSLDVIVNNYEWIEFEGMTTIITEGDFYLAMEQLAPAPDAAPVGVDMENPTYFKSYVHFVGAPDWVLSPLQDFMIRAWIVGYNEPPRSIDYFQVARFSDFYPCGTTLYCDTTILDTMIYTSEYDDYAWDTLAAGLYSYGVKTHFTGGEWSDYDVSNGVIHLNYTFPPSCFYQADTANMPLIICQPHDLNGAIPNDFLGFNLYREGDLIDFLPPSTTSVTPAMEQPGIYLFELTAVYDLAPFGYPGETIESCALTSEYVMRYGYPLPFLEQWNLGTFEINNWTTDGSNWSINGNQGNPDPSAEFTWDPILTNYESSLTSYPFQADSMTEGQIYLDFDIRLDNVAPTGTEFMLIQVWNWESQLWVSADSLSNIDGSFDWMAEHLDITSLAMGQVFKIRFLAQGENSINILGWLIDNIEVYRTCNPPETLYTQFVPGGGMELNWDIPQGLFEPKWIHWDDGVNSGTSIGTGDPTEFDVAARWEPSQLVDYDGASVTKISFFPAEPAAIYHVRLWIGSGAYALVCDQPVTPIIGQWNTVTLTAPVPIDITQELWVGYYINTPTGYPAGVDDGPAIDGYGNLINFGGWQTLLQVNPDLDYNWNIQAWVEIIENKSAKKFDSPKYAIYRSDDNSPYFFRDYSTQNQYFDDSAICITGSSNLIEYKVNALYIEGNDTCVSDFSNESGQLCWFNIDTQSESEVRIYPNPCNDLLKIESSEDLGLISLYNSFGELILKKKVDEKQLEIPVSAYPAGVYMIRVETDVETISKKIVVMH